MSKWSKQEKSSGPPTDPGTSKRLSKQRQKGTKPEHAVRRTVHALGFRYRLHASDLPGSPDIVNRRQKWAIFVHGCFWHGHRDCPRATLPRNNREFWKAKFSANRARDMRSLRELEERGFDVLVIWECEIQDQLRLARRLGMFLKKPAGPHAASR